MRETERQLMARLKREAEEAEAAKAAAEAGGTDEDGASQQPSEEVGKKSESAERKGTTTTGKKKKASPAKKTGGGDKGKKGKGGAKKGSAAAAESQTPTIKGKNTKKKASPPKKTKASGSPSTKKKASKSEPPPEPSPTEQPDELVDSDSDDESDGSYELSTCCECGQLEDRSADIPILLCDGCDNECHLTCAKDRPKLTKVPEGDWYCSTCVKKRKKAGGKKPKAKKLTLEERKRLDAEKAAAAAGATGSTLSNEELAGLVASSEKKGKPKKKVDMDDFDMDSSSSDSSSEDDANVKPWANKVKKEKEEAPSEPAVARKKTFEEVKQEMIEKKMKNKAGTATAAATGSGAVKTESKPTISLIQSMAPPSAVAASAVPLGRAAVGAAGRPQSFGQQQQQQQKSWNAAPVKREPGQSSSAPTPHQPPRGSSQRSPVPPASPHPPILDSPEKKAQSRSLLGKLDGVIDTVTDAPIGGGNDTSSLAWTGSDQDRLRARNNGMDFVSISFQCPLRFNYATTV